MIKALDWKYRGKKYRGKFFKINKKTRLKSLKGR